MVHGMKGMKVGGEKVKNSEDIQGGWQMRGRKCVHGDENSKFTYHVNFQTATLGINPSFSFHSMNGTKGHEHTTSQPTNTGG